MKIADYIIQYFFNKDKSNLLNSETILSFNYLENGFFSSIEFIEMISDFEDQFSIQFLEHHMRDVKFSIVGSLIQMIEELCRERIPC